VATTTSHQWVDEVTERDLRDLEYRNQLPLEEVLDPYLEKFGAIFGGVVFALTLVAILVTNALHVGHGVFIITVPAAFLMLCRDLIYDWWNRGSNGRNGEPQTKQGQLPDIEPGNTQHDHPTTQSPRDNSPAGSSVPEKRESNEHRPPSFSYPPTIVPPSHSDVKLLHVPPEPAPTKPEMTLPPPSPHGSSKFEFPRSDSPTKVEDQIYTETGGTLYGLFLRLVALYERLPFPTVRTVLSHLPFALIPFAFCMFIIVEGLVTKGWVEILAKGWAIWANKSNAAVAIAGMGFVSVCMCNVSDPLLNFFCLFILFYSSQVQTSEQPFCCLACSNLGSRSTHHQNVWYMGRYVGPSAPEDLRLIPFNIDLRLGARCQLWRLQYRLQCLTSRNALEGHS